LAVLTRIRDNRGRWNRIAERLLATMVVALGVDASAQVPKTVSGPPIDEMTPVATGV